MIGLNKKLDYNIKDNISRAELVRALFTPEVSAQVALRYTEPSTQQELETIANYILYGKDPKTNKNVCQQKQIQIKAAHSSYARKEPESLDAILEDPNYSELDLHPISVNLHTKKVKPKIDRELDKDIPGMQELWHSIDALAKQVSVLKENGELGLEYYRKNHLLIELRREQFTLKDSFKKEVLCFGYHGGGGPPASLSCDTGYLIDWETELKYSLFQQEHYKDSELLCAIAKNQENLARAKIAHGIDWEWREVSENQVDLRNPQHVYGVAENYSILKENSYEQLGADAKFLLWEFEDAVERAHLDKVRRAILIWKIDKLTNLQIASRLYDEFGISYGENYISTIFTKNVCGKIAEAAQVLYDEYRYKNDESKFKICTTCGNRLLRDTRFFIKKSSSPDGLASRCKECDKKLRDRRKKNEG